MKKCCTTLTSQTKWQFNVFLRNTKKVCTFSSDKTWILSKHIVISKNYQFFHLAKSKHNNIDVIPESPESFTKMSCNLCATQRCTFFSLRLAQLWNTIHIGPFLLSTSSFFFPTLRSSWNIYIHKKEKKRRFEKLTFFFLSLCCHTKSVWLAATTINSNWNKLFYFSYGLSVSKDRSK